MSSRTIEPPGEYKSPVFYHSKMEFTSLPCLEPSRVRVSFLESGDFSSIRDRRMLADERRNLYLLNRREMRCIEKLLPKWRGIPRVDDKLVLSGIIYVIRNGLCWKDAPRGYGPYKTLYSRFIRWSRKGIFLRILYRLARKSANIRTLMIDATYIPVHRTACSLGLRKIAGKQGRRIGKSPGGWTSKLHIVCDEDGRPIDLYLSGGNVSDYDGAKVLLKRFPRAAQLLADRGYDADWFREALKKKGIEPCIPGRKNRKNPPAYDAELYKDRHKIENSFSPIKDWRRVWVRYDRCPDAFLSACAIAIIVQFWL